MSKIVIAAAAAAGYVLGAKAGHGRYEQIMSSLQRFKRDPQVRQKASEAAGVLKHKVMPGAKEKLEKGADRATEAVKSDTASDDGAPGVGVSGDGASGQGRQDGPAAPGMTGGHR